MDHSDLSKKLTEKQCIELHKFLVSQLKDALKHGFDYAAELDCDPKETIKYFSSFLYVAGMPIVSDKVINSCMDEILSSSNNEIIIDFPNSRSSENK